MLADLLSAKVSANSQLSERRGSPVVVVRHVRGQRPQVEARYDAAQTTDFNKNHWAAADSLSPNAAASASARRRIRERARYEVANNTYARGMVNTLADYTIGTGPRLQVLLDDEAAATRIEDRFNRWAAVVKLARKLWTMRVAKAVDGEGIGLLVGNPNLADPVKLDIKLIECDRVCSPSLIDYEMGKNKVDGIIFDDAGNPVEYHILKHHPGNAYGGSALEYDTVAAEYVIHLFRADRPGQKRGVSEIAPSLPLYAQLRRYTVAVLGAAESAASQALVIQSKNPPNEADEEVEVAAMDEVELSAYMATTLPMGYELGQVKAEQPSTAYAEFKGEVLNEIARVLNMPYNIAAGNSSKYNYASGRLDHQSFFKTIGVEQANTFEADALDSRILPAWAREDGLLHPMDYAAVKYFGHEWFWPELGEADPVKEAKAEDIKLKNRSTSLAFAWARKGLDWEKQLELIAKIKNKMKALGLTAADVSPDDGDDDDEDEDKDKEKD